MKKIFCQIFALILFISSSGCAGYKPIFVSENLQFQIANYSIKGNKILGNQIYSKLQRLSKSNKDNQNAKSINFFINVSKTKNSTLKNTTGKILEYKINLSTEIKITDFLTEDKILNQTFTSSLTYKVQDQYSDTIKLENKSIENLVNKTYEELLIRFSEKL